MTEIVTNPSHWHLGEGVDNLSQIFTGHLVCFPPPGGSASLASVLGGWNQGSAPLLPPSYPPAPRQGRRVTAVQSLVPIATTRPAFWPKILRVYGSLISAYSSGKLYIGPAQYGPLQTHIWQNPIDHVAFTVTFQNRDKSKELTLHLFLHCVLWLVNI